MIKANIVHSIACVVVADITPKRNYLSIRGTFEVLSTVKPMVTPQQPLRNLGIRFVPKNGSNNYTWFKFSLLEYRITPQVWVD